MRPLGGDNLIPSWVKKKKRRPIKNLSGTISNTSSEIERGQLCKPFSINLSASDRMKNITLVWKL